MQDFSAQQLRGHDFRGQNLAGAKFVRADLRGADFREANLAGADFSSAQLGIPPLRQGLLLALTLTAGTITALGLSYGLTRVLGYLGQPEQMAQTLGLQPVLLLGLLGFLLLLTLHQGVGRLNQWLLRILVILVILISMILGNYPAWGLGLAMICLALSLSAGLAQTTAIALALTEQVQGQLASCAVGGVMLAAASSLTFSAVPTPGLAASITLGAIALGAYLGWQLSAPLQRPLQRIVVAIGATGGAQFARADLMLANFTQAQLKGTDLRRARLMRTQFQNSQDLDKAWFSRTAIQRHPEVRSLLVSAQGGRQSLREVNLSGASLGGANLHGADLRDADLTQANLAGANLEEADLTRANLLGADLSGARLSGACIMDWNIDATTQLGGVDCRYLYRRPQQRDPALGTWPGGEFTRLFAAQEQDQGNIFDLAAPSAESAINPQEVLASLMVLARLAIADNALESPERQLLQEALQALELPADITLERVLDDRTSLETLLGKLTSPIIREKVYQSAYLMARIDGDLEAPEIELLDRIQTKLNLSQGKVEKLQTMVSEAQNLSIAEQVQAIRDPAQREAAVDTNIRLMSVMHAFSGAMPIPGFAIVTHLMIYKDQVELVQKIARIWGYPDDHQSPELERALFGSMGATAARVALSNVALLIPVWGSVVGASTAFSMTWAIGEMTKQFFGNPDGQNWDEAGLKQQFAQAKQLGQKVFQDSQELISAKQREIAGIVQELQESLRSGKITQQDYLQQFRDRVRGIE
jgi:uncharacterized protein YjbI with pentapeptide repeats/uncharacterized protein (DUF697 family)